MISREQKRVQKRERQRARESVCARESDHHFVCNCIRQLVGPPHSVPEGGPRVGPLAAHHVEEFVHGAFDPRFAFTVLHIL